VSAEKKLSDIAAEYASTVTLRDDDIRRITETLKSLKPGEYRTVVKITPSGSLQLRCTDAATLFYFRFSFDKSTDRVPIGEHDPRLPAKQRTPSGGRFSFTAALVRATAMAILHDQHRAQGGIRRFLQQESGKPTAVASSAALESVSSKQMVQPSAGVGPDSALQPDVSLSSLCTAYWDSLCKREAPSWRDAKNIMTKNVIVAHPGLAAEPAATVTARQIANILREMNESGRGRTGNKLRSFLRAAFNKAMTADTDPNVDEIFKRFRIEFNPVASIPPLAGVNRPDKRPLSLDELRCYWGSIQKLGGLRGAALRVHLFAGGPRIAQLCRLERKFIQGNQITLFDTKGRDTTPRSYALPLPKACSADLQVLIETGGRYAISEDGGLNPLYFSTLSRWAAEAVGDQIQNFQLKRVRSGVQTLFTQLGVPHEVSGRIQSHGLAGVVNRHYDGYDYVSEKQSALEKLWAAIVQPAQKSTRQRGSGRGRNPESFNSRGFVYRRGWSIR
jgi:integrase